MFVWSWGNPAQKSMRLKESPLFAISEYVIATLLSFVCTDLWYQTRACLSLVQCRYRTIQWVQLSEQKGCLSGNGVFAELISKLFLTT